MIDEQIIIGISLLGVYWVLLFFAFLSGFRIVHYFAVLWLFFVTYVCWSQNLSGILVAIILSYVASGAICLFLK